MLRDYCRCILQMEKGHGVGKGPVAFVGFSEGHVTSGKQKSMAVISFHSGDISHSLWMLIPFSPVTVSRRAETEWHLGFAFRNDASTALVFFQARHKTELNSFTSTLTQGEMFRSLGCWERQCPPPGFTQPSFTWLLFESHPWPWLHTVGLYHFPEYTQSSTP